LAAPFFANVVPALTILRTATVVLHASWWVAGAVIGTAGLGGLVGALGLSTLLKRLSVKAVYPLSFVAMAVFAVGQAMTVNPLGLLFLMFGVSICGQVGNVALG